MTRYAWLTFTSDYGLENKFTGVCRGVIARIAPDVKILDITHLVPQSDVRHGAVVFDQAIGYLPSPAVHLVVVDPGVGTARRPVILRAGAELLVGPDNGLLTWAADRLGGIDEAYEISPAEVALEPMSTTFHGRDLFAPAAAHLAAGREPSDIGTELDPGTLVRLPRPVLSVTDGEIRGEVLIVDRFGNLQTSVGPEQLGELGITEGAKVLVETDGVERVLPFVSAFGEVPEGELLAHLDSAPLLALAANRGRASDLLGLGEQDTFRLRLAG